MSRAVLVATVAVLALAGACSSDDGGSSASSGTSAGEGGGSPTTAPIVAPSSIEAAPSSGCENGAVEAGQTTETLEVDGEERQYLRDVPGAHGEEPVPVVVDFHGYSEGAGIHAQHSALGPFGEREGFVTLTPQGQGEIPFWDTATDGKDLPFVEQLLDTVEADLCVDTNRVFVTGLSNGAFMTSAVACAFEERVAAVAPVAGITDPEGCGFDRPVPVIAFHGTDDDFVRYDGGFGASAAELPSADGSGETLVESGQVDESAAGGDSVPEIAAAWAGRNGCRAEPDESTVADDVTLLRWDCPAGATTEVYRVDGGGHTWPGSDFSARIVDVVGTTTFSIDANELMWDFFTDHPLGV